MTRALTCAGLALLVAARALHAQRTDEWPSRLGEATRDSLTRVADSARTARLPVEMLLAKAAEGVLKGADDARILRAVRGLARNLLEARGALPVTASAGTLGAAASALQAGMSLSTLRRLAASLGHARDESDLAIAFVTLADLVASRVPAEAAATSIEVLLERRAPDAEFAAFRAGVAQDIAAGRAPEEALSVRAQALVRRLEPPGRTPVRP